jgi:spermidine synthase
LVYELAWSRALIVPLGNSFDATTMVLATFMLGMACGAWMGGRLAERVKSALLLYALAEILLGLFALSAPALLRELSNIPASFGWLSWSRGGLGVRYWLGGTLIALPCLAMGASLPLLIRGLTGGRVLVGHRIGIVYGANTLGAALGACWAGFWGLAQLGVARCSALAALGSLVAAVLAALTSWRHQPDLVVLERTVEDPPSPTARATALSAALVGGFMMLACEVVWARVLTLIFGHDTYAFSVLLALVLAGLSLGGFAQRALARLDQHRVVGVLLGLFGASLALSYSFSCGVVIARGRDPFAWSAKQALHGSVWLEFLRELSFTPLLVLGPALLAGALYPATCSLYAGKATDAGRRVGVIALVNGVGASLGTAAAALGGISLLGIQGTITSVAVLSALLSTLLLFVGWPRGGSSCKRAAAAIARLGPLVFTAWAVGRTPARLSEKLLLAVVGPRHQELLYYEEARTASVAVIKNQINDERQLLVNAVNEVTTRLVHDQSFKLLGHLGPLLHPEPRTAVMICLGAGISAGAALTHPLVKLDVVDLSSAVARAARHFTGENNGVLDDPRFHLYTEDGRQFLLNSSERYDLAIIDSTHPKSVDSWILYTREFYQLVHDRLQAGGIAVQWLPLHGLSEREFKLIVRTFSGIFEHTTLWANAGVETYGQVAYAKLVGVRGRPLSIDTKLLARRLAEPRVQRDLLPYGMARPEEILDAFVAGSPALRRWTDGLPEQTDDHPWVPYTTELSRGRRMTPALLLGVRSRIDAWLRPGDTDGLASRERERAYDAQGLVLAGNLARAAELYPEGQKLGLFLAQATTIVPYYTALAQRYGDDPERLFEAGTQLGALGHSLEAKPIYEQALTLRPWDDSLRLNFGLLLMGVGAIDQSLGVFTRLRSERPGTALVLANLGAVLMAKGDLEAAKAQFKEALAWDRESLGTRLALAETYLGLGEPKAAAEELTELLARSPWMEEAHDLLGLVRERMGDYGGSIEQHRRAIDLNPYLPGFHAHLGRALAKTEAWEAAVNAYREALRLEPRVPSVLVELGQAYAAQEDWEDAVESYLMALDVDPAHAPAALQLGLTLERQGRIEEATQAFCQALTADPALLRARRQMVRLGLDPEGCEP